MIKAQAELLDLISGGIWGMEVQGNTAEFSWQEIYSLAKTQAVIPLALMAAAVHRKSIPAELYERWRREMIGLTLHSERLMQVQDGILAALRAANIKCAVLKGSSLSVYYPDAQMRPLGDIDLLAAKADMQRAADVLRGMGYQASEAEHPFHMGFYGNGMTVELHRAVSAFPDNPGGRYAQSIMDEGLRHVRMQRLAAHEFPVLSDAHQALSLLLHMERHMMEGGMGLRQLCDWAVFAAAVPKAAFKDEILPILEGCGLARFACVITRICVQYLRLDACRVDWAMQADEACADALMAEFMRTGNFGMADREDMSDFLVEKNGSAPVVQAFFFNLNERARRHFPVVRKLPVLLPVFWVYLPLRYVCRMLAGRRARKSLSRSVTVAQNRNRLYRSLGLFEAEASQGECSSRPDWQKGGNTNGKNFQRS